MRQAFSAIGSAANELIDQSEGGVPGRPTWTAFKLMAVVDRVKEGIRDFDPSRFVSLCCARIDPRRGELRYVNAGHLEPIIRSGAARPILLDSTGPILSSALFDIPCEQATAVLGPGDSLLLYTDGVTESHGPGGMFGQERLVTAILGGRRGADLLDALLSEVVAFSNSPNNQDDITLLALDLAEPAAADDGCWASEFWTTDDHDGYNRHQKCHRRR